MKPTTRPFPQNYRINALRLMSATFLCLLAVVAPKQEFTILSHSLKLIGTIAVFAAIAGRAWSLLWRQEERQLGG